jgi:hypothetical protein
MQHFASLREITGVLYALRLCAKYGVLYALRLCAKNHSTYALREKNYARFAPKLHSMVISTLLPTAFTPDPW